MESVPRIVRGARPRVACARCGAFQWASARTWAFWAVENGTLTSPISLLEKIIDELEELDDIRLYDETAHERGDSVPFETAVKEIEQEYGE